jgi:hypothetical protein
LPSPRRYGLAIKNFALYAAINNWDFDDAHRFMPHAGLLNEAAAEAELQDLAASTWRAALGPTPDEGVRPRVR